MKSLSCFIIIALLLIVSPILIARVSSAQVSPYVYVSDLRLAPGQFDPIPDTFEESVNVNVTANVPISNVTLYYLAIPMNYNASQFPQNLSDYNHVVMIPVNPAEVNGTYYYQIPPPQPNNTKVIGYAQAFSKNYSSNIAYGDVLYTVVSPPPQLNITFGVSLLDVNPLSIGLNMSAYGQVYNTENYAHFFSWDSNTFTSVPQIEPTTLVSQFYAPPSNVITYCAGEPNLFPFDSYNCTFSITLAPGWNITSVTFAPQGSSTSFAMIGNKPYYNYIPQYGNFTQRSDLAEWKISSTITYIPATNSSMPSEIQVDIQLVSRSTQTLSLFIVPVFSMFALLGSSIILQSDRDKTNRIAIYLTVIVFSFGFFTGIRNLATLPETIGLTMIELLTLSLIPATVSLGVFSMIGVRLGSFRFYLDGIAVLTALVFTYVLTEFTGYAYKPPYGAADYSFLSLGWWAALLILSLSGGFLFVLGHKTWSKYRDNVKSLLKKARPTTNAGHRTMTQ